MLIDGPLPKNASPNEATKGTIRHSHLLIPLRQLGLQVPDLTRESLLLVRHVLLCSTDGHQREISGLAGTPQGLIGLRKLFFCLHQRLVGSVVVFTPFLQRPPERIPICLHAFDVGLVRHHLDFGNQSKTKNMTVEGGYGSINTIQSSLFGFNNLTVAPSQQKSILLFASKKGSMRVCRTGGMTYL